MCNTTGPSPEWFCSRRCWLPWQQHPESLPHHPLRSPVFCYFCSHLFSSLSMLTYSSFLVCDRLCCCRHAAQWACKQATGHHVDGTLGRGPGSLIPAKDMVHVKSIVVLHISPMCCPAISPILQDGFSDLQYACVRCQCFMQKLNCYPRLCFPLCKPHAQGFYRTKPAVHTCLSCTLSVEKDIIHTLLPFVNPCIGAWIVYFIRLNRE